MDELGYFDNLQYTYAGNKLYNVKDNVLNELDNTGFQDDKNNANDITVEEYFYDLNGNLTEDKNKGITEIKYNYLNLPKKITVNGKSTEYIYDAAGTKLAKITSLDTRYYVSNFEYIKPVNGSAALEYMHHEEGRIRISGSNYIYDYALKDHLGNVRVMFTNNAGTAGKLQENEYYPFGMRFNNTANFQSIPNYYLFNGKEIQEEINFYDFGSRYYDPVLGRWHVPDPVDQFASPYIGIGNNPVNFTDPNGESVILAILIGVAIGAYLGGSAAEGGEFNPTKWAWDSDTWIGMGIGGAAGALGGWGFAAGGAALAGALGTALPSFSATSIAVASYGLAGGVMGGAVGFVSGFGGGYLYSGGNMDYALQSGSFYAGIGTTIGMTAGVLYGFSEDARSDIERKRQQLREFYIDKDGTHRSVDQYEGYKERVNNGTAPDWMERAYNKWTDKININTTPSNLLQGNIGYNNSIYLGDYNQTGNWDVFGQPAFDLNTSFRFGSNTYNYNIATFGTWEMGGGLNGIRNVNINTSGTFYGAGGALHMGLVLRLRVWH